MPASRPTPDRTAAAESRRRERNAAAERDRVEWLVERMTEHLPNEVERRAMAGRIRSHPEIPEALIRRPGTLPFPDRPAGEPQPDRAPELAGIDHIIVVMMENHSFDNYFGMLPHLVPARAIVDGFPEVAGGVPTVTNRDTNGAPHRAFRLAPGELHLDPVVQTWDASHIAVAGGTMDGFVVASSPNAMAYYDDATLPFYYSLAEQFPICDRYHASTLAMTHPNRVFMLAGSSGGMVTTEFPPDSARLPNGHVIDQLEAYGIDWGAWFTNLPTMSLLGKSWAAQRLGTRMHGPYIDSRLTLAALHHRMRHGGLPAVTLVDPDYLRGSEEWPQNVRAGQEFVERLVRMVMAHEPTWRRSMIILNYDEHGGYYDHVAPPRALPPGDGMMPEAPEYRRYGDNFSRLGVRVPCIVISPWSKPGYVSHRLYDHTSVLATIARKFNLPALTYRDANANHLGDCLVSGGEPPFLTPPPLTPAPRVPPEEKPKSEPYHRRLARRALQGREATQQGLTRDGARPWPAHGGLV